MILGIGTDLVDAKRIEHLVNTKGDAMRILKWLK